MKASENQKIKEKINKISSKPFPCKLTQGQSMIDKFEHSKAMSASIKDVKEKK